MFFGGGQQAPFLQPLFQSEQSYWNLLAPVPGQLLDYRKDGVSLKVDFLIFQPAVVFALGPPISACIFPSADLCISPSPGSGIAWTITVAVGQVPPAAAEGCTKKLQEPLHRVAARLVLLLVPCRIA